MLCCLLEVGLQLQQLLLALPSRYLCSFLETFDPAVKAAFISMAVFTSELVEQRETLGSHGLYLSCHHLPLGLQQLGY